MPMILLAVFTVLQSLPTGSIAASIPCSDATREDAFSGAPVEWADNGGWDSCMPWFSEKVEVSLGPHGQR